MQWSQKIAAIIDIRLVPSNKSYATFHIGTSLTTRTTSDFYESLKLIDEIFIKN